MKTKPGHTVYWLMLAILALSAAVIFSIPVQAENPLPPRDTTPAAHKPSTGGPTGASIELAAPRAPDGAAAVVQWQDSAGGWQDVTGWQGAISDSSRWWVHPKDFGTGPFRWVVTTGADTTAWGVSEPFHLPSAANVLLQIAVNPAD
jgi:hypothetical protein